MSYLSHNRGFTVLELMVSLTIMVIISTVIASGQSKYTSGASLKNIANDLGLSLRQAQVYGISVKEFDPGSSNFNLGYGVVFNLDSPPVGSNTSFIFFADRDRDFIYDDGWNCSVADDECLDKTTLSSGNYISELCIIDTGEPICNGIERLDISFVRPAIEARIYYNETSTGVRGARIGLRSPEGEEHSVTVYTTGQISVQ